MDVSDDAAKGHKSIYNWVGCFLETVEGVHGANAAHIRYVLDISNPVHGEKGENS